jgi:hypothetical protein
VIGAILEFDEENCRERAESLGAPEATLGEVMEDSVKAVNREPADIAQKRRRQG